MKTLKDIAITIRDIWGRTPTKFQARVEATGLAFATGFGTHLAGGDIKAAFAAGVGAVVLYYRAHPITLGEE